MSLAKVATATLLAMGVLAYVAPHSFAMDMKTLDPDGDGTISLDEAKAAAEAKFGMLDPDKDGSLDKKEAKGIMKKGAFKMADPDKDGSVDKAEYMSAVEAAFKKADPDGDGTVDAKEMKTKAGKALMKLISN